MVLFIQAGTQMLPWQLVFQCSVPVFSKLKPFLYAVQPARSASIWSQALEREFPAKLRVELLPRCTCSGWQSLGSVFSRWAFWQMVLQWLQLSSGLILSAQRRVDDQIWFLSWRSLPCLMVGQGCSEQLLWPPQPTTLFIMMEVIQILFLFLLLPHYYHQCSYIQAGRYPRNLSRDISVKENIIQ